MDSLFHDLLVPTDGSENSLQAGELAFRLAEQQRARVTLLHVVDPEVLKETIQVSEESEEQVRGKMERQGQNYLDHLERVAERYQVETRREMLEGDPYREIVDLAGERGIDLIVMGHAGLRGPRRKIAGSVAERVIRFAHCPVLVLGAGA